MKPRRFAPGIYIVDEIGSLEAEEWVRQEYIQHGLRPPSPIRLTPVPADSPTSRRTTAEENHHGNVSR